MLLDEFETLDAEFNELDAVDPLEALDKEFDEFCTLEVLDAFDEEFDEGEELDELGEFDALDVESDTDEFYVLDLFYCLDELD